MRSLQLGFIRPHLPSTDMPSECLIVSGGVDNILTLETVAAYSLRRRRPRAALTAFDHCLPSDCGELPYEECSWNDGMS